MQLIRCIAPASILIALQLVAAAPALPADPVPEQYKALADALGKTGDFKDGVFKLNIPRGDLAVTIRGRAVPTPLGFGGWLAFAKGDGDAEVMMGDLVLTLDEVNPVMSAILDQGLEVTALHNHFFWEEPRIFYMHVHGRGSSSELARKVKPAIALIDEVMKRSASQSKTAAAASGGVPLDGAALAKIVGHQGEQNGPVYKITIGRPDLDLRDHGASINARMGLNTWAAFTGSEGDAVVAGDVAMLQHEVTPVLRSLRSNGIDVVAIHHHMVGTDPVVIFLHYYGVGPSSKLATAVRQAVDLLGKPAPKH